MKCTAAVALADTDVCTCGKINSFQGCTILEGILFPKIPQVREIHVFQGRAVPEYAIQISHLGQRYRFQCPTAREAIRSEAGRIRTDDRLQGRAAIEGIVGNGGNMLIDQFGDCPHDIPRSACASLRAPD